jgi:hypothetical protein
MNILILLLLTSASIVYLVSNAHDLEEKIIEKCYSHNLYYCDR